MSLEVSSAGPAIGCVICMPKTPNELKPNAVGSKMVCEAVSQKYHDSCWGNQLTLAGVLHLMTLINHMLIIIVTIYVPYFMISFISKYLGSSRKSSRWHDGSVSDSVANNQLAPQCFCGSTVEYWQLDFKMNLCSIHSIGLSDSRS